jgi:hypothetical protein
MTTHDDLSTLFFVFYLERGDIETCACYKKYIKDFPEIEQIWNDYKLKVEEADIIFRNRFMKILDKLEDKKECR